MAADNRSIVITLKLDSGNNDEQKPTDTATTKQSTDKGSTAKAIAAFAVTQIIEKAASEAVAWGEYYFNKEFTLNDDYVGQRNKQIAVQQINAGVGAVSTIGSMASSGAMIGGPVGAIVGAIIGTVTAGANIIRSNVQGREQQDIMLRQIDAQLGFTRSRAGWSVNAGSIGEDL